MIRAECTHNGIAHDIIIDKSVAKTNEAFREQGIEQTRERAGAGAIWPR